MRERVMIKITKFGCATKSPRIHSKEAFRWTLWWWLYGVVMVVKLSDNLSGLPSHCRFRSFFKKTFLRFEERCFWCSDSTIVNLPAICSQVVCSFFYTIDCAS